MNLEAFESKEALPSYEHVIEAVGTLSEEFAKTSLAHVVEPNPEQ